MIQLKYLAVFQLKTRTGQLTKYYTRRSDCTKFINKGARGRKRTYKLGPMLTIKAEDLSKYPLVENDSAWTLCQLGTVPVISMAEYVKSIYYRNL